MKDANPFSLKLFECGVGERNLAAFCPFLVCRRTINHLQAIRKSFGCGWHGVLGISLGYVSLNMVYILIIYVLCEGLCF